MAGAYPWFKALHIVFVTSWFAGLFYLPRLFVNLALVERDGDSVGTRAERARLLTMARKLYRFMTPLAALALGFGAVLWLGYGVGLGEGNGWMHAKLVIVAMLVAYHAGCGALLRTFERGENHRTDRWYRFFNEGPVLALFAIIVLVVVKPF